MRIGYPCINRSLAPAGQSGRTFRLASYTEARFCTTVEQNLAGLQEILRYNERHGLLFFRITSQLVPFASHAVCTVPWWQLFAAPLAAIGRQIRQAGIRITMHPDQFILLNSPRPDVVERSVAELLYHARVFDAMGLDTTARIQLHVGGTYGDKPAALERFAARFTRLDDVIRRRLTIENDDRHYDAADCLELHARLGLPVLFDFFHYRLLNRGEAVTEVLRRVCGTWDKPAGVPLTDYSSQQAGGRRGAHAETLDEEDFRRTLAEVRAFDFDVMLEIKDKERSALRTLAILAADPRLITCPQSPSATPG